MNKMTAIIADDEANLAAYLKKLLQEIWPELEIIGAASNGLEALSLIREEEPDIAFLDIKMPVFTGLQVAERIQGECHIVFITAYDEYAVQAFESEAIDYLLKPVETDRLSKTVERLKAITQQSPAPDALSGLLEQFIKDTGTKPPRYISWIRAGEHDRIQMIAVDEVIYFRAEDKYTSVITAEKEHLIRKSIRELVTELDPDTFWQIHRGIIVQVSQITLARKQSNGTVELNLNGIQDKVTVSRRYAHLFKQM